MSYERPTKYEEEDFAGFTKHDVLSSEVEALVHNVEAAGVSPSDVVYALQEVIKELRK